jgi:hypothetical protein
VGKGIALVAGIVMALVGAAPAHALEIEVLSSRADLVSGGDALVRISGADAQGLTVKLGSKDVTSQFAKRANGEIGALLGDIPNAKATLTATTAKGNGAKLTLTGHPNGGPLISGPQMHPWICQAGAKDEQCNQPATYELQAKTQAGFTKYDPKNPPSGIAQTTTTEGKKVPFIVRVETGYQDRDQYKIATLYDPSAKTTPWTPPAGSNRRLVFTHGGSCGTDRKAGSSPDVMNEELLGKGFIVASTALNNLGHNCNPVLIAESELMARERVIEQYGPVKATLGTGCSGGSIAQTMLAHAYPGFYDGITVACTFADLFTTGKHAVAGHLFKNFFNVLSVQGGQVYTPADQALVNGTPLATGDDLFFDTAFWPAIDGSGGCGGLGADTPRWSPSTPDGVRCGVLDHNVNVLGKGRTGYVGIPFDNVGVQYGLKALEQGTLSPAKFADLNARIGGLDPATLQPSPQRTEADLSALVNSYRAGYMAIGNTLADTPILEGRGSNEATAHVTYPTMVLRKRLDEQAGSHASHVLYQGPVPLLGGVDFANRMVLDMDRWVRAIQKDERRTSRAAKVREDKPKDIVDHCELAKGVEQPGTDCPALVRYYDSPSQSAGESLSNDILKCQLKPLRREDYKVTFTDAQWAQLQQAFPSGVCDWTKPGVGEQPTVPWLTFADGPGGRPLGDPPVSEPLTPAKVSAQITRKRVKGGRIKLGCRVTGATMRSCTITVLRGKRKLRTVSLKRGTKTGKASGRLTLRAVITTTEGEKLTATRLAR